MLNISTVSDHNTARTNLESASQRAEHLYLLGVKNVLELCVGPSLRVLEQVYAKLGISVVGNDIDHRWKKYYPNGKWIIGDALTINYSSFDAVVFAPPLSKGCSGKREDALSINNVFPRYNDFLNSCKNYSGNIVLVLPARSMATKNDREQYYNLISGLNNFETIPLTSGKRNIVKYYDLYAKL